MAQRKRDELGRFVVGDVGGPGRKPEVYRDAECMRKGLVKYQPQVLTRLKAVLDDPSHPQHAQTLRWWVDKILPDPPPAPMPVIDIEGVQPMTGDQVQGMLAAMVATGDPRLCSVSMMRLLSQIMDLIQQSPRPDGLEGLMRDPAEALTDMLNTRAAADRAQEQRERDRQQREALTYAEPEGGEH